MSTDTTEWKWGGGGNTQCVNVYSARLCHTANYNVLSTLPDGCTKLSLGTRADSPGKTLMLGKGEQEEKGTTEDGMVGWHHRLNGHEFEPTPGVGEGQGSLACCSLQGHKETDAT